MKVDGMDITVFNERKPGCEAHATYPVFIQTTVCMCILCHSHVIYVNVNVLSHYLFVIMDCSCWTPS